MRRTETIDKIKDVLHNVSPKSQVILYGSQARGDARPDSDIDLLILLDLDKDRPSLSDKMLITDPLYDIELDDGVSIHSIVYTKRQWENRPFVTPFYLNVMNEGIKL